MFFYYLFLYCVWILLLLFWHDRLTNWEQHNCWNVACNNSYSEAIIHIKQGEASFSFACLRLYAFQKSFPQDVRMTLIPMWSCRFPPVAPHTIKYTQSDTEWHTCTREFKDKTLPWLGFRGKYTFLANNIMLDKE